MPSDFHGPSRVRQLVLLLALFVFAAIALNIVISMVKPLVPALLVGAGLYAAYKIFYMRRW
jgi:hypothetical protein